MYKEDVVYPLVLILLIVLLLVLVGFLGSRECAQKAGLLDVEYTYQFVSLTSCRVDCLDDGNFIPIGNCMRSIP